MTLRESIDAINAVLPTGWTYEIEISAGRRLSGRFAVIQLYLCRGEDDEGQWHDFPALAALTAFAVGEMTVDHDNMIDEVGEVTNEVD